MAEQPARKTAGALDIRNLIGALLAVYGVLLTVMGLWFTSKSERAKVDGANLNLQVGIGLLVAAAVFIGWALLRPIKVPVETPAERDAEEGSAADAATAGTATAGPASPDSPDPRPERRPPAP
jgi:uncharacterized membrane protein